MRFKLKIKGKEYEIEILEEERMIKIKVGEKEFFFGEREEISVVNPILPKRDFSKKEIISPITGVISEIFIKEGDFIKRDQKVLLISAMKMENEIVSDFEGRIKEILVKKNQEVKEGDILIILQ